MKIEALVPLEIRAGETIVTLVPGQCLDLTEQQGRSLLAKVPDKVRVIEGDWLDAFRELRDLVCRIPSDDARLESLSIWLNVAEAAYLIRSWSCFCESAVEVKRIAKEK